MELEDEEFSASEVGMWRASTAGFSDFALGTLRAPGLDAAPAMLTQTSASSMHLYSHITAPT